VGTLAGGGARCMQVVGNGSNVRTVAESGEEQKMLRREAGFPNLALMGVLILL